MKKNNYLHRCMLMLSVVVAMLLQARAEEAKYMVISTLSNPDNVVLLNDLEVITFDDEALAVRLIPEGSIFVDYDDFVRITFTDNSGVEDAKAVTNIAIAYRATDKCVTVTSTAPLTLVSVYDLQGQLIRHAAPCSPSATLSIADYPRGVYIVRASDGEQIETQKIIKN